MDQSQVRECAVCKSAFTVVPYTIRFKDGRVITRFSNKKFCSEKCSFTSNFKNHHDYYKNYWLTRPHLFAWKKERLCDFCKKPFIPTNSVQINCSAKCARRKFRKKYHKYLLLKQSEWFKKARKKDPIRWRNKVYERRIKMFGKGRGKGNFHKDCFTKEDWEAILLRWGNVCAICGRGKTLVELTVDHIIPLSLGGKHCKENIQPLCRSCNSRKGNSIIGSYEEK